MDFIFPLAAILSETVAKTVDKLNFSRNRIAATHLMRLVFIGMATSLLLYIVLAGKPMPHFSAIALGLMILIGLVSFAGNVFDYWSLKSDDLSLREPMSGFGPILAGLFGYLFFPVERKSTFLPAFILSIAIVYFGTHRRRLGTKQKKGMFYLSLTVFLYALLPSIYKQTLPYITPEYIALFRVIAILALVSIFMPLKKHVKQGKRSVKRRIYGLASGVIYALGTVTSLYAIQKLGVVQTMLLLLLSQALIYLTSYFILREKVHKGEVVSSLCLAIVVLGAIAL